MKKRTPKRVSNRVQKLANMIGTLLHNGVEPYEIRQIEGLTPVQIDNLISKRQRYFCNKTNTKLFEINLQKLAKQRLGHFIGEKEIKSEGSLNFKLGEKTAKDIGSISDIMMKFKKKGYLTADEVVGLVYVAKDLSESLHIPTITVGQ